jgi:hypothetical protein
MTRVCRLSSPMFRFKDGDFVGGNGLGLDIVARSKRVRPPRQFIGVINASRIQKIEIRQQLLFLQHGGVGLAHSEHPRRGCSDLQFNADHTQMFHTLRTVSSTFNFSWVTSAWKAVTPAQARVAASVLEGALALGRPLVRQP